MPDLEKVTKGLMCCQYSSKSHCDGCPYCYEELCETNDCTADLASDALALLKKREAIEPGVYSEGTCTCGNCGTPVGYYPSGCSIPRKLSKYCPNCGREVKWE